MTAHGLVTRRLERMPYGLAKFEITDPDGYVICLSQLLEDGSDLPTPAEVGDPAEERGVELAPQVR